MMICKVLLFAFFIAKGQCVNFIIKNNEIGPVWVGILGDAGKAQLLNGGFVLEAFSETNVSAPDNWAGRFWARTWCYWDTQHCDTGDCGSKLECNGNAGAPPMTHAKFTLRGWKGKDSYDVSVVDGFNVKISIEPLDGRGDGTEYSCTKTACDYYINDECPDELKLIGEHASFAIGCKSACVAFNTDEYCCRGNYGASETCRAANWPINYPAFFKKRCPSAFTYAYDDHGSIFTCIANTYRIVFG